MADFTQFMRDNGTWLIPVVLLLLTGVGYLIRRALSSENGHESERQTQKVGNGSSAIQAGRDVKIGRT